MRLRAAVHTQRAGACAIRNAPMHRCALCARVYVRERAFTRRGLRLFSCRRLSPGFLCLSRLSLCIFFFFLSLSLSLLPRDPTLPSPRTLSRFALFRRKSRKKERGRLSAPQFFILDERRAKTPRHYATNAGRFRGFFTRNRVSLLGNIQIHWR